MKHAALLLAALLPLALGACASPIVGGACETGYTNCHAQCIDTRNDPLNCSGCGIVCPTTAPFCASSMCVTDAGPPDLGFDSGFDAGPPRDLGPDLDFDGGYHMPPCELGEIRCGGLCVPATHDARHCGSCTNVCAPGQFCAAGACQTSCASPLTNCGGECIDTATDARNCMTCGNACTSGICLDSMCSIGRVGHIVLIGHDYNNTIGAQDKELGNAVLIATPRPVRLLTFAGAARPGAVANADHAIDTAAAAASVTITRASAITVDEVPLRLASADVFLVYAQHDAIDPDLTGEGTSWSAALAGFLARGGIVIVLDDDSPVNQGTWQILTSAGLLNNTSRTVISGTDVHVVAAGDQVALGVPTTYRAQTSTVRFDSTDAVIVVDDGAAHPVVVHRTISP